MEIGYLPVIGLIIGPTIVAIVIGWFKGVKNTETGTLTGSVKLEYLGTDVVTLKAEMKNGFDRMEEFQKERDRRHDEENNRMWAKLSEIDSTVKLNSYRLDSLERERIRYYRDDKDKGAV
jgi:hypothetical protein